MKTMEKSSEKMVCVAGMMVPESMVEGRLKALARGREITARKDEAIEATRQEEIQKLRRSGLSDSEIYLELNAQSAATAVSHGFIRPARVARVGKPQWGPTMMIH